MAAPRSAPKVTAVGLLIVVPPWVLRSDWPGCYQTSQPVQADECFNVYVI